MRMFNDVYTTTTKNESSCGPTNLTSIPGSTISSIRVGQTDYGITLNSEAKEDVLNYILSKIGQVPKLEHKCHNCGGTVEMDADNHIFKCPYCESVYAIGTYMINDRG